MRLPSSIEGEIPKLEAIGVHNGTIYRWNRLCYGQNNGVPHMRIENRYIPAGPSVKDEVANALFWIGIMQGMPDKYKNLSESTPFNEVKGNFINAARTGINTYFNWFGKGISARRLILEELLPIAREGLVKSEIDQADIDKYLGIIEKRASTETYWCPMAEIQQSHFENQDDQRYSQCHFDGPFIQESKIWKTGP